MNWWQMETKEAARRLETDEKQGLTSQMAAERLAQKGRNELAETDGKKSLFWRFLAQFDDFMILLLLGAAVVSVVISRLSGENDVLDAVMILGIVVLNAALGLFQESKAEKALEALKKMAAPHARVIRDGIVREISAAEVVPGDLLLLETGDAVCADGRVVESRSLKTEESALTGEALPVEKTSVGGLPEETATGDRKNMVLAGGYVVYGKGKVLVTATGMDTEMGKIAGALAEAQEGQTPLQRKLSQLSKILTWLVLGICAVIFGVQLLRAGSFTADVVVDSLWWRFLWQWRPFRRGWLLWLQ